MLVVAASCAIVMQAIVTVTHCHLWHSCACGRDPRHHSGDEGGTLSESVSLEAVCTVLWWALLGGG